MILRLIYKLWRLLFRTVVAVVLLLFAFITIVTLLLQLPVSKDFLNREISSAFNEQFRGTLEIEQIEGFLPFNTIFSEGRIFSPGDSLQPLLHFEKAAVSIRWWEMLRRNLTIHSFALESPTFYITTEEGSTNFAIAFQNRGDQRLQSDERRAMRFLNRVDLFAPSIQIVRGEATIADDVSLPEFLQIPAPLNLKELNLDLFLEIRESQIFADIYTFQAELPETILRFIRMNGQFYSDDQFLELNRFEISTSPFQADFSFEATPLNLRGSDLPTQFRNAGYRIDVSQSSFEPEWIAQYLPGFPRFDDPVEIEIRTEGTEDRFFVDKLQAMIGSSSLLFSAELNNLFDPSLSYQVSLDNIVISPEKFVWIGETYFADSTLLNPYQLGTVRGSLSGDLSGFTTRFRAESESGSFSLNGDLGFAESITYSFEAEVDTLNISPFIGDSYSESIIQGRIRAEGKGTGKNAIFTSQIDLSQSQLLDTKFHSFIANLEYSERGFVFDLLGNDSLFTISADGRYTNLDSGAQLLAEGELTGFELHRIWREFQADKSRFNTTFSLNVRGSDFTDVSGRAGFEIRESMIDGEVLPSHQFYADVSNLSNGVRQLRITSSFLDAEARGDLNWDQIVSAYNYWSDLLLTKIDDEILFRSDDSLLSSSNVSPNEITPLSLNLQFSIKDLSLLRRYFPTLPELESSASATLEVTASDQQLVATGMYSDPRFKFSSNSGDQINSAFTAIFRKDRLFSEFSTLDLQLAAASAEINGQKLENSYLNISMRNGSIEIEQEFNRLQQDLTLSSQLKAILSDEGMDLTIEKLNLKGSRYNWTNSKTAALFYSRDKSITIDHFLLMSNEQILEIEGVVSDNPDDALHYTVSNLNLQTISDLIGGRVTFSGILNGEFTTRTLGLTPVIDGEMVVEEGRLMDRLIGDLSLSSRFNPDQERFDTQISIFTNPERYPTYIRNNDGIGQDIFLDGFFRLPNGDFETDTDLVYFDIDFREVDIWIVTVIIPNIIRELDGRAHGHGFFRAGSDYIDFDSSFRINDATGTPQFTNVEYTLSGDVQFSFDDGVVLSDVQLRDSRNGSGQLFGQIDLHRFTPLTTIDLTLDLNNLHFMNNSFDPDIPFYGTIFGTGQATITGPTTAPLLRTTRPLAISSDSRISIPLQPEVEFEQDRRFIRFVDSFEDLSWTSLLSEGRDEQGNGEESEALTFLQLFTMDLQFQANDPVNVRLIFDPVTNDILSTSGTGQIRILLADQDVSMFGRFNIDGGNYQFVSGDVFTRRFTLEEGGTISWSGDLIDAALNVTAVFRARPNISTLLSGSGGAGFIDPSQRIPVELVLHIGGTINAVENEFFFRLPTGVEGTADPTIASQISNLNQNEDEKLIQATSILLSGNFIPSSQAQGLGIAEGLSGTAVVVNPLLTSQVINPLLSNQINSLLRRDITFDIDVNLTTANEVDLGVALRLFDDRIVLRREGQITGEQSDIGDLGATYRINRTLSINAFHRQDPTLSYTSGLETRQSQEMNGVGVEARVQFNTWKQLKERITDAFRSLFGIRQEDEPELAAAEI